MLAAGPAEQVHLGPGQVDRRRHERQSRHAGHRLDDVRQLGPAHKHTSVEIRLLSTIGFLVGAEMERARLETEYVRLSDRLETRKLLDRAKSVLQRDFQLTEEEAYRRMQRESQERRMAMKDIAEAILLAEDLRRGLDSG